MAKHSSDILALAKRGAEARLADLKQEIKLLIDLFPHLRDAFDKDELPLSFIMSTESGRAATKRNGARQRSQMSASARKAVSARMKKYWAAKRKTAKA